MARRLDDIAHRADLGDPPGIHHRHPVRGFGDHAHIVRHQHHRRAVLPAEALEERDDLRLDRNIERGRGLVGDEQARIGRERKRDHHALAHAARKFVRIAVDAPSGGRNADFRQQFERAGPRRPLAEVEMGRNRFGELAAYGVERVEAGQRVLEHGADLLAANAAHGFRREIVDALAGETDTPVRNSSRRLQQADDRHAGQRLAGAGLADHAQHLAFFYREGNIVHRNQHAAPRRELDPEVLDLKQWHRIAPVRRPASL